MYTISLKNSDDEKKYPLYDQILCIITVWIPISGDG